MQKNRLTHSKLEKVTFFHYPSNMFFLNRTENKKDFLLFLSFSVLFNFSSDLSLTLPICHPWLYGFFLLAWGTGDIWSLKDSSWFHSGVVYFTQKYFFHLEILVTDLNRLISCIKLLIQSLDCFWKVQCIMLHWG